MRITIFLVIYVLTGPLREMGRKTLSLAGGAVGEMDDSSHSRDGNPETQQGGRLAIDVKVKG